MSKFVKGEGLNTETGEMVPMFGFEHDGMFIVDPDISECGRFEEMPSYYGLTEAEAQELRDLNK